jgi:prolyl-tRNA synthetase
MKGVPVRIAIGARDLENGTAEVARRDTKEKMSLQMLGLAEKLEHLLAQIQDNIFQKALQFRDENIVHVDSYEEFKNALNGKGGFIAAHWDGTSETEEKIKQETKATIRCIPLNNKQEEGKCIYSGKPSNQRVLFAVAY